LFFNHIPVKSWWPYALEVLGDGYIFFCCHPAPLKSFNAVAKHFSPDAYLPDITKSEQEHA